MREPGDLRGRVGKEWENVANGKEVKEQGKNDFSEYTLLYSPDTLNDRKVSHAPKLNKQLMSTRKWGDPISNANTSRLTCVTDEYLNHTEEARMESAELRNLGKQYFDCIL